MQSVLRGMMIVTLGMVGAGVAHAQTASRTADETNMLDRATDFSKNVIAPLKIDRFKDYVPPKYVEHFPGLDGTLESLVGFFRDIAKQMPNGIPYSEPVLALADGDITLMLNPGESAGGKQPLQAEIQRWKDGKQVEHWDVDAIGAPPSAPNGSHRSAAERQNLDLVVNFWRKALEPLKTDEFGTYVAADFVEHDSQVPTGGLVPFEKFIGAMRKDHPNGLPQTTFVLTLVDGDLVSISHVKDGGPDPKDPAKRRQILGIDVMRVHNGKIVEHWGDTRLAAAAKTAN